MQTMNLTKEPGSWSAEDLLDNYGIMGIPHFQRGLVWKNDSISLLLESLYFGTPCGTIILWEPKNQDGISEYGEPLPGCKDPRYLIIDGQQRIRSLWDVFHKKKGESGEIPSDEDKGPDDGPAADEANAEDDIVNRRSTWCLNLGRLPELEDDFRGGKRFMLFRCAKDPSKKDGTKNDPETEKEKGKKQHSDPAKYDKEALFPLGLMSEDGGYVKSTHNAKAVKAVLTRPNIKEQLEGMKTKKLFNIVLLKEMEGFDFKKVVAVYNRINSAGKRVEEEEKAFANLVAFPTKINTVYREFLAMHDRDSNTPGKSRLERDDDLKRQEENRFGLLLFIRTFVQAWTYHSHRKLGASTFSFSSVTPETLDKLKNQNHAERHVENILKETKDVLICVRGVLRDKLFCDDLRMLPDTSSFWPVFQLLIQYPDLRSQNDIIAFLLFRQVIVKRTKNELLKIITKIDESVTSSDAIEAFKVEGTLSESVLRRGLSGARSPYSRYTLLLYWLVRKRGAKDFDYEKNNAGIKHEVVAIDEECEPSKQHMVPYSLLKQIYPELSKKGRVNSHDANNIGNFTYISAELNGLEWLVDRPVKLRKEPAENRKHHLLDGDKILKAFERACDQALRPRDRKKSYRRFCQMRRDKLCQGFMEFHKELRGRTKKAEVLLRRSPPALAPRLLHLDKVQTPGRIRKKTGHDGIWTEQRFMDDASKNLKREQREAIQALCELSKELKAEISWKRLTVNSGGKANIILAPTGELRLYSFCSDGKLLLHFPRSGSRSVRSRRRQFRAELIKAKFIDAQDSRNKTKVKIAIDDWMAKVPIFKGILVRLLSGE